MDRGTQRIRVRLDAVLKHVRASDLGTLPDRCAAYVIHGESGKRYVGSSNTARARVQAHKGALDPAVREPIRSVCCYLTAQHMDARILEYWLMREIAPELNNACPDGAGCDGDRCRKRCEEIADPGRELAFDVEVVRVLENVPKEEAGGLPDGPGAYVIRTETGKRYVGFSNALRSRVRTHLDNPADPNIGEPVKTVSAYETRTEADAQILEYALIRDLRPELNRENQPDASEWTEGKLGALFKPGDPLRAVYEDLRRRILADLGVEPVVRKKWITFQVAAMKNFCAVKVLSDCLQVDLKVGDGFEDPRDVSERIARTQVWTFDRRVRIRNRADLDAARDLIRQAFDSQKS